jgi:hypothetical protein
MRPLYNPILQIRTAVLELRPDSTTKPSVWGWGVSGGRNHIMTSMCVCVRRPKENALTLLHNYERSNKIWEVVPKLSSL